MIYCFDISYDLDESFEKKEGVYNVSSVAEGEKGTKEWGTIEYLTAYGVIKYKKYLNHSTYLINVDIDSHRYLPLNESNIYEYFKSLVLMSVRSEKINKLVD